MILPASASAVVAQPVVASAPTVAGSLFSTTLSLALVLAVIFGLAWVLRWMQQGRVGGVGALRINAGIQVGPKEKMLLVQAGDRHLLIGVAPGHVQTLHVFDQAPVIESSQPIHAELSPFAEKLRQLLQPKQST
jgi:flagellar protein FliO/FliZ